MALNVRYDENMRYNIMCIIASEGLSSLIALFLFCKSYNVFQLLKLNSFLTSIVWPITVQAYFVPLYVGSFMRFY